MLPKQWRYRDTEKRQKEKRNRDDDRREDTYSQFILIDLIDKQTEKHRDVPCRQSQTTIIRLRKSNVTYVNGQRREWEIHYNCI